MICILMCLYIQRNVFGNYSDARYSCGNDYFTWINIISIFLVDAFISPGLFRMLTIFVIYFTYVVQVVMTLDHIGH